MNLNFSSISIYWASQRTCVEYNGLRLRNQQTIVFYRRNPWITIKSFKKKTLRTSTHCHYWADKFLFLNLLPIKAASYPTFLKWTFPVFGSNSHSNLPKIGSKAIGTSPPVVQRPKCDDAVRSINNSIETSSSCQRKAKSTVEVA